MTTAPVNTQQRSPVLDFSTLMKLQTQSQQTGTDTTVPGPLDTVKTLSEMLVGLSSQLPTLPEPSSKGTDDADDTKETDDAGDAKGTGAAGDAKGSASGVGSSSAGTTLLGGLNIGGLSLEVLLDAVGFEQRRTETKAGISSLEAHAQERAQANEEKIKSIQEQLEKSKSQGFLDGLLKAFKYIGMALAAIGSAAMIAVGAVGLAAGGSGVALIAVGVASFALLTSSITEELTDGKVGFSPAFITGKIMEACGASESAIAWTKMAVELLTSVVLIVASCGAGAAGSASKAVQTTTEAAAKTAEVATKAASKGVETFQKVASITARTATALGGANTIAQSATSIASASNQKEISFLQAQQKRLEAILERISIANDLDLEHLKEMMQRSEQTLQTVSDIVQEGAEANVAIMSGNPAMA